MRKELIKCYERKRNAFSFMIKNKTQTIFDG